MLYEILVSAFSEPSAAGVTPSFVFYSFTRCIASSLESAEISARVDVSRELSPSDVLTVSVSLPEDVFFATCSP